MRHRHGGMGARAWTALAIAALLVLCCPAGATAAKQTTTRLNIKLKGLSQAELTTKNRIRAKVRSSRDARVRLKLVIHQGEIDRRITKRKSLKVKAGKRKSQKLPLTDRGTSLVQSCLKTKLELVAKLGKRKVGDSTKRMVRDPERCDGTTPLNVALDTADRCDPITPVGTECLFPYPNDHFTRPDARTDRPARSTSTRSRCRRTRPASTSTRPTSTPATGSAPARRSSSTSRDGHPGGVRGTGRCRSRHGPGLRRPPADRRSSTPPPASAS